MSVPEPVIPDIYGQDLYPLIRDASDKYNLLKVAILAMLWAESEMNTRAERYGVWPDVSFGLSQMTVATAAGYGVGDGSASNENIEAVKAQLWDPAVSIDLGAHHLEAAFVMTKDEAEGDEAIIWALAYYNAGTYAFRSSYWQQYASNVARYRHGLAWAHEQLGE